MKKTKGISKYRHHYIDRTGEIINNLKIIKDDGTRSTTGIVLWLVRCYCGKEFYTRYNRIKTGATQSCGCYQKKSASKMAKSKIGSKHHNWNPNLTEEDRLKDRDVQEVVHWRNAVYKRDNYTCQICGKNYGFNAHHLDGWHWCKERRFDVSDGITLCVKCHDDFHKKYGRKNNTEQQFQEYIKLIKTEDEDSE